jgi:glycosyltransferase involved in cell wall biosynthesis
MRILLLLNGRFPTEKAYGIQTLTMAKGYADLGHEVAVAFPRRTSENPMPLSGVTFLPFGPYLKLVHPWFFPILRFFGAFQARKVIHTFRPDLVIVNDPLQAAVLSKMFPVVWELHDLPNLQRYARRFLVKMILRNVLGIVSTNVLKLDALRKIFTEIPPALTVSNAVTFDLHVYREIDRSVARRSLAIPTEEISLVYAGQLFDWKGVDTIIESARFLPSQVVIHLVGGTGMDLERCKKLVGELSSGSARILVHGMRPKEEIPTWLRAATLVVIPNSGKFEVSVRDTNPLKLFEALAAGAAIIASDLPSIREVVGDQNGVVRVPPDDAKALARAVLELVEDSTRLEMMRRASATFPVLNAEKRAKKIVEFAHTLLTPR